MRRIEMLRERAMPAINDARACTGPCAVRRARIRRIAKGKAG